MTGAAGAAGTGLEEVRLLPYGAHALLAEVSSTAVAAELYAAARTLLALGPAVAEVVPGARTVLFDGVGDLEELRRRLVPWRPGPGSAPGPGAALPGLASDRSSATVEVPTTYDGADLEDVARRWGMTREEAVATHVGTLHTVAFCGFSPGFAYCTGLPEALAVPRRTEPRPRVPAGSVAVADLFTGVYPAASPGGWQLLGRTALTLWDPRAAQPALLTPGTSVRFVRVPAGDTGREPG